MKHFLFLLCMCAGACMISSCQKSTNSSEYNSVWRPYSSTVWERPSGIENFSADDGGFSFDVAVSASNLKDTLKFTFAPAIYKISNIESGADAQLTISAAVTSKLDSMKLVGGTQYTFYQFGKVSGAVRTFGKDSVLTTARIFPSETQFTYKPSINPDSCSRRMTVQLFVNWKAYTGAAVTDTLTTTKITVKVKDLSLTVTGVDILK